MTASAGVIPLSQNLRPRVVAHSLARFRGNYKYNLLHDNLRAFNAQVPMLAQWDDHEVTNDWSSVKTSLPVLDCNSSAASISPAGPGS